MVSTRAVFGVTDNNVRERAEPKEIVAINAGEKGRPGAGMEEAFVITCTLACIPLGRPDDRVRVRCALLPCFPAFS
jgi:hypothetical protein